MMPFEFESELESLVGLLKEGKIILYPTDTIWGIGCDIHFSESVDRIFKIKKRSTAKSMILLVDSIDMLKRYVERVHPRIETLMSYHTRPLTVIYPRTKNLPDHVLAEDRSVAIRVCEDPFCKELIRRLDSPIISTSANFSNDDPPSNFAEIPEDLKSMVDYVVRYRQNDRTPNQPSTIIKYDKSGEFEVIRE